MLSRRLILATLALSLTNPQLVFGAGKEWRSGKLLSIDQTEQPIVRAPQKQTTDNSQYSSGQNNSSSTTTSTTTVTGGPTGRSVKTYWYVVTDGSKYYTARITANLFNVTTAAKIDVGDIRFYVDGKNLFLQGADGKDYKTEIVRTALTPPTQPPDPGPPIVQDDRPI